MAKDGKKVAIGLGAAALAITAVVLIAQAAKAAPPPPEPGLANLYGIVKDGVSGQPISGVLVTLDGRQTQTDGSGSYAVNNIQPGVYTVQFSKSGYQTATF